MKVRLKFIIFKPGGYTKLHQPPPPPNAKINSLIYNTYLFVISCIVDQNLLVVANMQAYNSLTKIRYFQANAFLSWRRAENHRRTGGWGWGGGAAPPPPPNFLRIYLFGQKLSCHSGNDGLVVRRIY